MMMKKTIAILVLAVALIAGMIWSPPAQAAEPFIGQIVMFGGNFAPRSWAYCDGQLLAISLNTALFSILGTTYGGDGRTTFALPDLRGRVPMGPRRGPSLSSYTLGQRGGAERVTLSINQIPSHTHQARAYSEQGNQQGPGGNALAYDRRETQYSDQAPDVNMSAQAILPTGGSQPHENRQPFLCVNFIIALQGFYPSRN